MSIFIKELSDNKFEIIINKKPITKHTVLLTDEYHDSLTKKRISKKKLLEYSFQFLWIENLIHPFCHFLSYILYLNTCQNMRMKQKISLLKIEK